MRALLISSDQFQDRDVVVDGNLIVSRQFSEPPAFLHAILSALGLK